MEAREAGKRAYREAYERWQQDVQRLHRVLLDGEALDPLHRVALLRAESHSYERYREARQQFFGLAPSGGERSPFFDEDKDEDEANA